MDDDSYLEMEYEDRMGFIEYHGPNDDSDFYDRDDYDDWYDADEEYDRD